MWLSTVAQKKRNFKPGDARMKSLVKLVGIYSFISHQSIHEVVVVGDTKVLSRAEKA
jgi:hypothetical protein